MDCKKPHSQASPGFGMKQKEVKNREGLGTLITRMTSDGREVDVGGEGFAFK